MTPEEGRHRFCPGCGTPSGAGGSFCATCGTSLLRAGSDSASSGIVTPVTDQTPAPEGMLSEDARSKQRRGWTWGVAAGLVALVVIVALVVGLHHSPKTTAAVKIVPLRPTTTTSSATTTTSVSTTTTTIPPTPAGFDYQAAVQKVQSLGYSVLADESSNESVGPLYVITATCTGSATGYCQNAFFFVGNQYIGPDTSGPDIGVSAIWQDGTTVALNYPLYEPSDPNCCPTGGSRTVRFNWNGSQLLPLDPLPANPNDVS